MIHLFPKGTNLSGKSLSIELINHMMESKVRMKYTDGDFLHVEPSGSYSFGCHCNDIFCQHGWSARFIMTIVTQSSKPIGATIDFNEIVFDDEDDGDFTDSMSHISESVLRMNEPCATGVPKPLFSNAQQQRRPSQSVNKDSGGKEPGNPLSGKLKRSMTDPADCMLKDQPSTWDLPDGFDAISRLANVVRIATEASGQVKGKVLGNREKESVKDKYLDAVQKVVDEMRAMGIGMMNDQDDLGPDDSSSNFGVRRGKQGRYMPTGTVLEDILENPQKNSEGVKSSMISQRSNTSKDLRLYQSQNSVAENIVQGFLKTRQMIDEEKDVVSSIRLINGLANPFRSDRLLILSHMHTALNTRKIRVEDPISLSEGLVRLSQSSGRTASERLLITIVSSTFDTERMVVIANAFDLPYIEIGMVISGAMLTKCFVQLSMEYEILWFKEMKGLRVPDFHSRFYSISESDPNTRSRVSTRHKGDKPDNHSKRHSSRRRGSSLLSWG